MSDEKVIEVRAGEKQQRALVGKIARLPHHIRGQVNRRIHDGEPGKKILSWLNDQAEVKKIMEAHFDGAAISHRNLSQWRHHGGYEQWRMRQEEIEEVRALAEEGGNFSQAAGSRMVHGAAAIAAARIFKMLKDPENSSPADVARMAFAAAALRQAEQGQARLGHEQTRVRLRHEEVTLQWDKHQRDVVAIADRVLTDEETKILHQADIDHEDKMELIGRRMFGDSWIPKELPEGEEKAAEAK